MVTYLLALLLLVAAGGIGMRPVLRKAFGSGSDSSVTVSGQPVEVVLELPRELQHLPEPPVLPAASVEFSIIPKSSGD